MSEAAWSELGYQREEFLDRVAALESQDAELWMCDLPASSDGTLIKDWATDWLHKCRGKTCLLLAS